MDDSPSPDPIMVVALAGVARSGKDTAAKFLIADHGFLRLSFADGIRAAFGAASGPSWDLHKEVEAGGRSLRWLMQTMGTECREESGCPDHWIEQVGILIRYLSHYHPQPRRRFVITDMRYPREVDVLRGILARWDARMEVWKIERPGLAPIAESAHSSETSLGGLIPDRILSNDLGKGNLDYWVDWCFCRFREAMAR